MNEFNGTSVRYWAESLRLEFGGGASGELGREKGTRKLHLCSVMHHLHLSNCNMPGTGPVRFMLCPGD